MSDSAEYLFATDLPMADRAARKQGWHPHGRTGWIKPDGKTNETAIYSFQRLRELNDSGTEVIFADEATRKRITAEIEQEKKKP